MLALAAALAEVENNVVALQQHILTQKQIAMYMAGQKIDLEAAMRRAREDQGGLKREAVQDEEGDLEKREQADQQALQEAQSKENSMDPASSLQDKIAAEEALQAAKDKLAIEAAALARKQAEAEVMSKQHVEDAAAGVGGKIEPSTLDALVSHCTLVILLLELVPSLLCLAPFWH